MAMNLAMAFVESANRDLRKTAIYWGDKEYSYAELLEQSARVANDLRQQFGVKPGGRVALWLKNCPEFVPALFGILAAGRIPTSYAPCSFVLGVSTVRTGQQLGGFPPAATACSASTAPPRLSTFTSCNPGTCFEFAS